MSAYYATGAQMLAQIDFRQRVWEADLLTRLRQPKAMLTYFLMLGQKIYFSTNIKIGVSQLDYVLLGMYCHFKRLRECFVQIQHLKDQSTSLCNIFNPLCLYYTFMYTDFFGDFFVDGREVLQ